MAGNARRDVVFHLVRIGLVVVALFATSVAIRRMREFPGPFERGWYARSWIALVVVSFACVLLMLLARRRAQSRSLRALEAVVALVLTVIPSGLLGFPPGPRWLQIALFGTSVQPLATAWLAIVLTRPSNPRVSAPISEQPADTIVDR